MLSNFIEESVHYQTGDVLKLYIVIAIVAFGIAIIMYNTAKKRKKK